MTVRSRRLAALVVVSVLVLGLGACGKKKSSSSSTTTPTEAATTSSSAATATGISIKGFAFSPTSMTVAHGATVSVANNDTAPHTVTSDDATSFDTQSIAAGATGSFTAPATAGTYQYHCKIHANMKHATLVVT
jgi:plastocyanin